MAHQSLNTCISHVDLCNLINVSPKSLNKAFYDRSYNTFTIKKPNGGNRKIENPNANLAHVQRQLSKVLNNTYAPFLPHCNHGYIPKAISGKRRDIFSNAIAHQGAQYLYNVDAKDFFYNVDKKKIASSISLICSKIDRDILKTIVKICTYKSRLPMGAPSSPALSNIATLPLDKDLMRFAREHQLVYTRYVDDMSFSSKDRAISDHFQSKISAITEQNGFKLNPNKMKLYGPQDDHLITGIIVKPKELDITPELYEDLINNIRKLGRLKSTYQHMKMLNHKLTDQNKSKYKQYKSSIKGQVAFVERVLGSESPKFIHLQSILNDVLLDNNYISQAMYI